MTTQDAKAYLADREIPQLFESLMTGLMFYRPEDHIAYLQECLKKIRADGVDKVRWNLFIESKRKTPLPPITPDNGRARTPAGGQRGESFITDGPKSLEERKGSPLPPIGHRGGETAPAQGSLKLPNCPIVLAMGGPGSGKATQCKKLLNRYDGWVHLSMGDLLRAEIFDKGNADDKWGAVSQLVNKGELAPDEMTADLIKDNIAKSMNAKGIIIEGYPRTMEQVQEFTNLIGRVDLAFILDCEEQYLIARLANRQKVTGRIDDNESAVQARVNFFREKTLPVIKHFDDMGKLAVVSVDGDRDEDEIFYDIATIFDNVFSNASAQPAAPRPPSSPRPKSTRATSAKKNRPASGGKTSPAARPGSGFTRVATTLDLKVKDTGRKTKVKCPIILIMGAPGSGKKAYAQKLAEKYPGYVHISSGKALRASDDARDAIMSGNLAPLEIASLAVKEAIDEMVNDKAKGVVLEGFPRTQEQLEYFNQNIGGLSHAILIDVDEDFMRKNVDSSEPNGKPEVVNKRISFFKHETLPILGYLDDNQKLTVVNGEDDSNEVFVTICDTVEYYEGKDKREQSMFEKDGDIEVERWDPPDVGRLDGLPKCPFFAIIGSPGSGVEDYAKKVADKYPNFVRVELGGKGVNELQEALTTHASAEGLILENFPMDMENAYTFNTAIGGLDQVIVLDCDEEFALKEASTPEINEYKNATLTLLSYYDSRSRLEVVDIQKNSEEEVIAACCKAIERAKERPRFQSGDGQPVPVIDVSVPDAGRKSALPTSHIISIISGPCGGASEICKKLTEEHKDSLHIPAYDLAADDIVSKLSKDAPVVFLEGFPKDKTQLEQFNDKVGGMSSVIVIDTSADFCRENGANADQISFYQSNTLPVLGHYDDFRQLDMVSGEQSFDDIYAEVNKAVGVTLSQSVKTDSS